MTTKIASEAFDLNPAMDSAVEAAEQAGREILKLRSEGFLEIETKGGNLQDIVTRADKASQKLIIGHLRKMYPNHSFRGEEADDARNRNEWEWIIDPIDGTTKFAHNQRSFGISIALAYHNEPMMGVVHFPELHKTLIAIKGKGAFLNQKPLLVAGSRSLNQATVAFDFSARPKRQEEAVQYLVPIVGAARSLEVHMCTTFSTLGILEGHMDAYVTADATPYDIAACMVIAREAGCKISGIGESIDLSKEGVSVILSNSQGLQNELEELLRTA
jgi:myo-inositol-1(or 4)-monophosphatase